MPKVLQPNDNVEHTVIRPIVFSVVRDLQARTGVAPTKIIFPGNAEVSYQPGSTIDEEISFNRTASQAVWKVSIKEERPPDSLLATAVFQAEHPAYFEDEALGLRVRPIYAPTILTINFEARFTDTTAARAWRDEFSSHISNNRNIQSHTVNYHYFIPKRFFPLIEHIYELRETQGGYGDDYDTYLETMFAPTATQISNLGGKEQRWGIAEQAGQITGIYENLEQPEEAQKQDDASAMKVSFGYRIYFDTPVASFVDYPVLVHNQLIDDRFIQALPEDDRETFQSRSPRSVTALSYFEVDRLATPTIKSGLRLPDFHEFSPQEAPRYTLQVLSALLGVEEGNRKIMDFTEFDEEWEFREQFLDHLRFDYQYLNRYGESLVNLVVYDGDIPLHHSMFFVDKDLNVFLNFDPDIRRTYYVRLSLLTSTATLSRAAKDRARNNAEGLRLIAAALAPSLVKQGKLPQPLKGTNYITRVDADRLYNDIDQITDGFRGGKLLDNAMVQWNTVMILYIETNKIEEKE